MSSRRPNVFAANADSEEQQQIATRPRRNGKRARRARHFRTDVFRRSTPAEDDRYYLVRKIAKLNEGYEGDVECPEVIVAQNNHFSECGCAAGRGHREHCALLPRAKAENARRNALHKRREAETLRAPVHTDDSPSKRAACGDDREKKEPLGLDAAIDAAADAAADAAFAAASTGEDWWNRPPTVTYVGEECGAQVWHTQYWDEAPNDGDDAAMASVKAVSSPS